MHARVQEGMMEGRKDKAQVHKAATHRQDRFLIKGCQSVPGFEAVALGGKATVKQ